jgi:DNA-binding transcriptional ArsR family regulator
MGTIAAAADAFRAVADPTRRAMLDLLTNGERTAGELADPFDMTRPAVSQHLRILQDAGLIRGRQDGRLRRYRINPRPLREVCAWVARYRELVDPAGHVWRIQDHGPRGITDHGQRGITDHGFHGFHGSPGIADHGFDGLARITTRDHGPEITTDGERGRSQRPGEDSMKASRWVGGLLVALAVQAPAAQERRGQTQDPGQLALPGNEHKRLEALVGDWRLDAEFRISPAAKWEKTSGRASYKQILGGRFVTEEASINLMGNQFEWMGIYGYDLRALKYTAVWVDNGDTGIERAEGTMDDAGKTITLNGEQAGPGPGTQPYKWVMTFDGPSRFTIEMHMVGQDGPEFANLRIVATRN